MTTTWKSLTAKQFEALHFLAQINAGHGNEARRSPGFLLPRRDVYMRLVAMGLAEASTTSATAAPHITEAGLAVIQGRA